MSLDSGWITWYFRWKRKQQEEALSPNLRDAQYSIVRVKGQWISLFMERLADKILYRRVLDRDLDRVSGRQLKQEVVDASPSMRIELDELLTLYEAHLLGGSALQPNTARVLFVEPRLANQWPLAQFGNTLNEIRFGPNAYDFGYLMAFSISASSYGYLGWLDYARNVQQRRQGIIGFRTDRYRWTILLQQSDGTWNLVGVTAPLNEEDPKGDLFLNRVLWKLTGNEDKRSDVPLRSNETLATFIRTALQDDYPNVHPWAILNKTWKENRSLDKDVYIELSPEGEKTLYNRVRDLVPIADMPFQAPTVAMEETVLAQPPVPVREDEKAKVRRDVLREQEFLESYETMPLYEGTVGFLHAVAKYTRDLCRLKLRNNRAAACKAFVDTENVSFAVFREMAIRTMARDAQAIGLRVSFLAPQEGKSTARDIINDLIRVPEQMLETYRLLLLMHPN